MYSMFESVHRETAFLGPFIIKCCHTDFIVNVSFGYQVSDTYKLMVLLPNLRIYNGKDVSTYANHLRYVYSDNLRTRVWN